MKERMALSEKIAKRKAQGYPKQKGPKTLVKDEAPSTTGKRKVTDKGIIKKDALKTISLKKADKYAPKGAGGKATGTDKHTPKGSVPKTVSAAQKAGKLYFMDKNNKPKLAITWAQLKQFQKKHGITSYSKALTKFANMYKPGSGMAKFKADMKKK